MKVDTEDPTRNEQYCFEPYEFIGESVFVQKVGKDVTQRDEEDAGYLVSLLTNGRDKTTELVIFDVEGMGALERGPVVRSPLPTFIPQGLHGFYAKGETFDFGPYEKK
jgi:carotenoid cleavage dioxygenase-like enzyme